MKKLKIFFHQKDIEEYRQVKILIFLLFKEVNFLYNILSERILYQNMNKLALLHRIDSEYAYPLDEKRLVLRLRVSKEDEFKVIEVFFNPAMRFIKERQVKEMKVKYVDNYFKYYEVTLFNNFPSFSYIFHIVTLDNEEYFLSDEGLSRSYDYSLSQVSAFRYAFINPDDVIKVNPKFEGRIFYQIFVDSFFKSESLNKDFVTRDWNSTDLEAFKDGKYHPIFLGGDLKGVTSKLNYLKDLGIGAIYLTPIFKANTNHRYDTLDYFEIDPRLGDLSDLKELVKKAHELDILVCLDLVFNHTSFFHPFFQDVLKNGKKSKYFDFYMIEGEEVKLEKPVNYYTFSESFMMPKLNGNNKEVQAYCIEVAKHYLKEADVDGYRLDVSNELPHSFWIEFKKELKKEKEDIFLIGECWYNAYSFLNSLEWDSSMNYASLFAAKEYFVNHTLSTKEFVYKLNSILVRYKENTNKMLLNLLDSHDISRFYEYLKPNKDLYLLSELFLISYIGLPMIYYGDEIFMEGGNDPFNRKGMEWDSSEFNSIEFSLLKKIFALRKFDSFKKGEMELEEKDGLLYIRRVYEDEKVTVILNNSTEEKVVENIDINNTKVVLSNHYEKSVLSAYGFLVLKG